MPLRSNTIQAIDGAMQALQAAMFAREVYFPEHAAVSAQQQRAHLILVDILQHQEQLTVIAFGDRVVVENQTLPSSSSLLEGLFERLRRHGIDSVTCTRGVADHEIGTILEQFHQDIEPGRPIQASAHIRFGYIKSAGVPPHPQTPNSQLVVPGHPVQQAAALQRLWRGLYETRDCKGDMLGSIVADICAAVASTGDTILPLASLKRHDEYTVIHTTNVAILTVALGEAIGLGSSAVHDLTVAALLHDVGKRQVPTQLLNKKGRLTDAEMQVIQHHPVAGARLLFDAQHVPELAPIVAYEHHINLDGTGYPKARPGSKPILASQIVQVADVFDALRTHRPYRAALSQAESIEIMGQGAGTVYDKTLLDIFIERVARQTNRAFDTATHSAA